MSQSSVPRTLASLTIHEFLDALAANVPTPGGGSVAALVGALAAGLGRMACSYSVGKPQFSDTEPRVAEIAQRLRREGQLIADLMDEDAAAYEQLAAAFKIPKTEPDRPAQITQAATMAAAIPFQVVTISRKIRLDLARLAPLSNPQLRSDVECGLHLAAAAMHAAAINVRVNLKFLPPPDAQRIETELTNLLADPTPGTS